MKTLIIAIFLLTATAEAGVIRWTAKHVGKAVKVAAKVIW